MTGALLVVLGAAVGAPVRLLVDAAVRHRFGDRFPAGILLVNVAGSFVLGLLVGLSSSAGLPDDVLLLVGTGFCGALTTFSSFGNDTVRLVEQGHVVRAGANVAANITLAFGAAALGVVLGGA